MFNSRRVAMRLLLVLVLGAIAPAAQAIYYNRLTQYFTDSAFTCEVGQQFSVGTACPDDEAYATGVTANYRKITVFFQCGGPDGAGTTTCAEYYNGAWHAMTCPGS
jgi:hypothetical protein